MVRSVNLGMPRIGAQRELKRAVESYWAGRIDADALESVAATIRADGWQRQRTAGIDSIPANDFAFYDQMLDTICLVGAIPERFRTDAPAMDTAFALARGRGGHGGGVHPLEMTKWFDTNYHYLVPELGPDTTFRASAAKPVAELREAAALGFNTRPVLIGPVTFLSLAKSTTPGFSPLALLPRVLPVYKQVLRELIAAGADWVQFDEPCLVTDLTDEQRAAYETTYATLARVPGHRSLLTTYFGGLGDNTTLALGLPVDGVHIDLVRAPEQLPAVLDALPTSTVLSLGVVDGRNVWRTDLRRALDVLEPVVAALGPDRVWVGPSCSLLHVPYDVSGEADIPRSVRAWLAFAVQKLDEVSALTRALTHGRDSIAAELALSDRVAARRAAARDDAGPVRARVAALEPASSTRRSPYGTRRAVQRQVLGLPLLPTTTIGSFPQTDDIRRARQQHVVGTIDDSTYDRFCRAEIERVVRAQEAIGLDVLVHGEPERNDMVQFFGERLDGFVSTANGWVQSYGTRCVRPPIIHGDVTRAAPMTVDLARFAQSLTSAPVKGMLTGPVTILQWSFVRDDQPGADTCRQIALAIRDEVADLEAAGIAVVQVDEPALREGLPLRRAARSEYLDWATECFRLATAVVRDETQVHTHMCYAEFGDILDAVRALDADVISLESARSGLDMLDRLAVDGYPAGIGPGVYDIHSPLVPTEADIAAVLARACAVVPIDQLWVNPDCGLKTRGWDEVSAALRNMVAATRRARASIPTAGAS